MENELLPFSTPRGRPPPTVVDVVSVRSRSSSSSSSSSSPPTVTFNKTLGVQANEEKEKEEEEVEAEIDDQERRLGSHITTRRSRLPPVAPPQATKKKAKCDVSRDPYDHDDSNSDNDNDNDFLESPTLRSRPPHSSRHRNRTTTASAGSDGLFPPTCDPLYYLYDLSSSSSSYYLPEHAMFSLIHNPRTFLRFIFGIVFLMCFLTNMVSGGPLAAQHLRDAFRGHRPWKTDNNERRDDDITQSQSSPPQGSSNVIRVAASPIQIDPHGVYIRASPLYSSSSSSDGRHPDTSRIIAGFASTSGSDRVLRVSSSTNSGASWSPLGEITRFPSDGTHDLDNAMPLALPSGRILFAFRHHSLSPSSSSTGFHYTFYRLDICSSSDGGRTWSFLSHIDQRAAANDKNGLWEPFLRVAADGNTIQAYYSSENSAGDQDNLMRYSTDEGKTWSDPPVLVSSSPTADSRDGMTGVSAISPSSPRELICVFETTSPDGTFSIARVLSHDDGLTWGERENVYMAQGGKWAGAPQVYLVGDTLVTSFLTNEGTDLPKIDGAYTKVVVSKDQGKTWTETGKAETVAGTGSHWPGLYSLNGTHFLALYSTDEMGAVSHLHSVS